jgi:general secretion pathway protein C
MKCRSVYSLSILVLMLSFWLPAPVNVRGGTALAQSASKPPKNGTPVQGQGDRRENTAQIPPAGPDIGWKLVGTAVMDDPGDSYAIMEYQSTGRQGAFQEGDRLGEILIKKILPDGVVIETGTGEEMLSVSAGGRGSGPSPPQGGALPQRRAVNPRYSDYTQLRREIGLRPHLEEGRPAGLIIYRIRPDSIFSQIGLQLGDVILDVNERPITTTRQAIDFFEALKAGGMISLKIKRGENMQHLRFQIQ